MSREELETAIADLGLSIEAVFVPWSQSRNYVKGAHLAPGEMSLNWKVTLKRNGRDVLTTDYGAGIAHCPSYNQGGWQKWTADYIEAIKYECEQGRQANVRRLPIMPDPVDVIWSLVSDSDVLTAGGFEEWASSFGFDTDSRKAEATYRACLDIAVKLLAGIGHSGLEKLQTAGEDY